MKITRNIYNCVYSQAREDLTETDRALEPFHKWQYASDDFRTLEAARRHAGKLQEQGYFGWIEQYRHAKVTINNKVYWVIDPEGGDAITAIEPF